MYIAVLAISIGVEVFYNSSSICGGGRGTCAVHWLNYKHLFDRGVNSIAAGYCPDFLAVCPRFLFLHPYMHMNRGAHACPLSVCIIQSLAENHYPEKQQHFGSMTQFVCVPPMYKWHMNAFQAPGNVAVVIWYLWMSWVQVRARLHDRP